MDINDLDISPELRAKVAACKTPEEILAIDNESRIMARKMLKTE